MRNIHTPTTGTAWRLTMCRDPELSQNQSDIERFKIQLRLPVCATKATTKCFDYNYLLACYFFTSNKKSNNFNSW